MRLLTFFDNSVLFIIEKIISTFYKEGSLMVKLNMGLKSALLAVTMMVAVPATTRTQEASSSVANTILSFVKSNKVAFVGAAALFIIDTRLRTRSRAEFSMDDLKQDFQELLNSMNILDSKLYKQLVFLFDKYVIGLPIKLEDCTKRMAKDEDGMVLTVKTKKLSQKPFGVYGLFDAYVLSQVKKFATETCAAAALLYVYLHSPEGFLNGAIDNAGKTLGITKPVNTVTDAKTATAETKPAVVAQ